MGGDLGAGQERLSAMGKDAAARPWVDLDDDLTQGGWTDLENFPLLRLEDMGGMRIVYCFVSHGWRLHGQHLNNESTFRRPATPITI